MKNKNIWLMGGFGNVLFQILAYEVFKKECKNINFVDTLVKKNFITKALRWKIHENIYKQFIPNENIKQINNYKAVFIVLIGFLSKKMQREFFLAGFFSEKNTNIQKSKNVFGYFQEKRFLKENKEQLLLLGKQIHAKYATKEPKTIIHYRAGDSVWAKQYQDYYLKVKQMIQNDIYIYIYISTDSPKQAMEFFKECKNVVLLESKTAMEDFMHMVSAKKLYCAPSTFSWWAAHALNDNASVVMPKFLDELLGVYIDQKRCRIV